MSTIVGHFTFLDAMYDEITTIETACLQSSACFDISVCFILLDHFTILKTLEMLISYLQGKETMD